MKGRRRPARAFSSTFRLLTDLTVLWAFLMLAGTGQIHALAVLLFLSVFVVSLFSRGRRLDLPNWVWTILSLVALTGTLFGWVYLGERMYSVVYLLLYLEANKILTARKSRDYLQLYGLTFFNVLAAAVSTTSVLFAPMLAVYIFLIIGAMMAFTIRRDAERAYSARTRTRKGQQVQAVPYRLRYNDERQINAVGQSAFMDRHFAGWLLASTAMVLFSGVAIFWVVPRAAEQRIVPSFQSSRSALRRSGFSEKISFSGMGEIQRDPTIVMRAMPDQEYLAMRPEFLRIRGTALDVFDGRTWSKAIDQYGLGREHMVMALGVEDSRLLQEIQSGIGKRFGATMTLEPESSGYLFLIDHPYSVEFDDRMHLVFDRRRKSLRLNSPLKRPISYHVTSYIQSPLNRQMYLEGNEAIGEIDTPSTYEEATLRQMSRIPDVLRGIGRTALIGSRQLTQAGPDLQLPDHPDMAIITQMARTWTEGLQSDAEKALEIERRFRSEYAYDLNVDFASRENHLRMFLQVERRGHCEYFATCQALMLRSLGIPARVVNGYLTDEWADTAGGYYIVRQEHAHSWVEAHLTGSPLWVTFDPTPAAGVGYNRIRRSLYHRFSRFYDMVKMIWYQAVIDYDMARQQESLIAMLRALRFSKRSAEGGIESIRSWWSDEETATYSGKRLLGWVLIAAALCLTAFQMRKMAGARVSSDRPRTRAPSETQQAVRPYVDLIKELEKSYGRPPSQTPMEFARRLANGGQGELSEFLPLTQGYYQVRFNHEPWTPQLTEWVEGIRERMGLGVPSAKQPQEGLRVERPSHS